VNAPRFEREAIDEQVQWLDGVLKTCRTLRRLPIDRKRLATDIRPADKVKESLP
jgi:hypothetical protein